ncbi:MAG: MMPL family transporter [Gammaproteobacteria bacterium]|nr:MMPL family transporter [Gammaproteobacteria bacterium]
MTHKLGKVYKWLVLDHPRSVIAGMLIVAVWAGWNAPSFRLDASADTLVLEHDSALDYFREVNARYSTNEFLVIAYRPEQDLFSDAVLADLTRLRDQLKQVDGVESVVTILDVPLLKTAGGPVAELDSNLQRLENPETDRQKAREELTTSPLFRDLLISAHGSTTALQINLSRDETYFELLTARETLREQARVNTPGTNLQNELAQAEDRFRLYKEQTADQLHDRIATVRAIMAPYRDNAEIYLGGVPMIADDMITFVRNDIMAFGIGVLLFIVATLTLIFRRLRWVLLPLATCGYTGLFMFGLLGFFDWPGTVISANFISLLMIITLSLTVHLIVRYREHHTQFPHAEQRELVEVATSKMGKPSLFTALTTIAAFTSLVVSDIRPVIDFGWTMTLGISAAFVISFLLFPATLMLMDVRQAPASSGGAEQLTGWFARVTDHHRQAILWGTIATFLLCGVGISRLKVENSFINYFKPSTEIYQGMKLIDQTLGGTTPLDVVIRFQDAQQQAAQEEAVESEGDDSWGSDDWGDGSSASWGDESTEPAENRDKYWFTREKMARIGEVHRYLESFPEVGKVLSLTTMMRIAESFNNGEPLGNLQLALLYSRIPDEFRTVVIDPYASVAANEARLTLRVRDSDHNLRRNELLQKLRAGMQSELGLQPDEYEFTSMLVLYNNMLQSLFRSQILTLGLVLVGIMLMFLVLFRSLPVALVAIVPNLLSAATVLGVMGWLQIPLDMMTITIAAIAIGIAVDNTIHYIHRFRVEFPKDRNYLAAMYRCHGSIGRAMYYTSLTITVGFSILVLSNFLPTIYFGLLTGMAMIVALVGDLALLPALFLLFKPLGPEGPAEQEPTAI